MSSEVTPSLLVVMAGYAKDNQLRPVAERWLHALRSISSKLVLVYDQDQLDGVPTSYQDSDNVEIVVMRHGAYDFGSYQRGLAIAEQRRWLDGVSHILLCNDSVIGPFGSLDAFVMPMLESGDPLWGVTDSNLYRPHLQSYFLLMRRDLYQVHAIRSFFDSIAPQKSRHDVIQAYELGFSRLICELGIQWRVFLSSDDMRDPRNGATMGNITAYPLCMLQKGAPVIKVKALTDPRSNFDGLAKTCAHLSQYYSELWSELWSSSELQPMWQSSLPVAVVLGQDDVSCLEERLDWIRFHPHQNLKAVIDVDENAIDLQLMLLDKFENELKDGLLTVLVAESDASFRARFLKKLVMVASDWIVCSQPELWNHPGALQCEIAHIMKTRVINSIGTDLKLWSCNYLLTEQGWEDFMASGSVPG